MKRILLALILALPFIANSATVTHEAATADTGTTPNTSDAFTPVAGDLLVVGVCVSSATDAAGTLSSSIGGFTFSQFDKAIFSSSAHTLYLYVSDALVSSASAQTVTWTETTDQGNGSNIMVAAIAGITLDGLDAIRQSAKEENVASTNPPSPTFPGVALTGNPTLGFVCNAVNPATMTEPVGWTEAADIGYDTPTVGGEYVFRNSGFTGDTITWGSDYGGGILAGSATVEIDSSAGAAPPTLDSAFTVSAETTDTYTLSYDASADADNIYVGAWVKDASAPTCDEIESGAGDVVIATEASTGSADSINLAIPGDDPFPIYDLYGCAENEAGDSSVTALVDETLDVPAGRQYVTKSGAPTPPEVGLVDGASPAAVDGDIIDAPTHTDSFALGEDAHELTVNADTTFSIAVGGDTSRQILTRRFYDVSVADWSDAPAVALAINDLAPVYVCDDDETFIFIQDAELGLALDGCWNDPEADAMTHAISDNPSGGSVADNEILDGAYDTCDVYTDPVLTATDEYGEDTAQNQTISVGAEVPDLVGMEEAEAIAIIEALCD